ncbi:class I SAM-dependent methyltransferase [Fictibacillus sp. B-59209]|uniref:class I SAM-dependent methyltransferase n=1 Tax=Fictibacillus sp. B-59209 TaxID=3024873 RepID=UPI002E1A74A8|nr:class I SAM-dependent methyltransferase [Fictibacillus sp. B-59209]
MNNGWNRKIYKVWSPFYDLFFNQGMFLRARQEVFNDAQFQKDDKILFAGVGTGADLKFLHSFSVDVTAIDYSAAMLNKAKENYANEEITYHQMDAQNLEFEEQSFDCVVASLILSVVPDPNLTIMEMVRVLKPKGQLIIFDKFLLKNKKLSFGKKAMKPFIALLGTDISVSFETLFKTISNDCVIKKDKEVMMNGMYRHIVIQKKNH